MAPKTTLSSWPERDTWVHNTKDVYEYAQKSMANNPPAVRNAISLQLAEHLRPKLVCKIVALDNEAHKLFTDCVQLIHAFVNGGARTPPALDALDSFVAEMEVIRSQEQAAKAREKKRRIRSAPEVPSDDEDDVQIVNKVPDEDTEMAEPKGLKDSVHAPKASEASKLRFKKNSDKDKEKEKEKEKDSPKDKEKSKSSSKLARAMSPAVEGKSNPPSAKRARFERSTVDLREETAEEAALRAAGYTSVLKQTVMIPFLQLETLQPDALLSIANYLRAEVATLEHNIQYMLGQYKLAYSKLEEANRVRLAKLGLENTPMAEDQPADSTTAAPVAGSSSST
ncbi:hypothetical protein VNI00_018200 [Paramarasmius palmivorus]|uniref:Uncharacterized protein n=1 Tax=Paramarasmius palmivorus TaxID=297713 RepID=A0AAW0B074_9AGAR